MNLSLYILLLTAYALAVPSNSPPKLSCSQRSVRVSRWTITNFDFHSSYVFTNPAHQNSWGYVNFTLGNPALDYVATCTASSDQLEDFFYGTLAYNCTVPSSARRDRATFDFSRPSGELRINQTWVCQEQGSRFTARGGVKLNLTCRDQRWVNPDWKEGQIFSTRNVDCNWLNIELPMDNISAVGR